MRTRLLTILTLVPTFLQAQPARLESADGEPRIVVTAVRSSRLMADRASVYVFVEGAGETPADAAQRASQKEHAVTAALRQLTVGLESVTPMQYGVFAATNLNGFTTGSAQASFVARWVIRLQLTRTDQIIPLTVAAIAAGASSAGPPSFESSSADSVRRVRYGEALAQARSDAEALASTLSGHLGALIEVSSSSGPSQSLNSGFLSFVNRFDVGGSAPSPDVTVSATVTVRYHFVPQ
jgi:uncharacterized protein YggE